MNYTSCIVNSSKRRILLPILVLMFFFSLNFNALALNGADSQLEMGGITTRLGNQVDLNLKLIDSTGISRSIGDLIVNEKPLILIPAYYKCPRLCGLLLGGVAQLVKDLELELGDDYRIATFSFNPTEGAEYAAEKKAHYTAVLAESAKSSEGWEFFVGEASQSKALISQLGFGIMEEGNEYAHSAAIFIIDKSGRISQFFTDIDFPAADVRLALVDASQGKIGSILDRAVLFCFQFDPEKGQYTWAVSRLMQLLGALSILFLGGIIVWQLFKERNRLT